MKTLLNYTDSKYLARLVREVNCICLSGDGVYWQGARCNRARMVGSVMQLQVIGLGNWFTPTDIEIFSAYGEKVCASRVP